MKLFVRSYADFTKAGEWGEEGRYVQEEASERVWGKNEENVQKSKGHIGRGQI